MPEKQIPVICNYILSIFDFLVYFNTCPPNNGFLSGTVSFKNMPVYMALYSHVATILPYYYYYCTISNFLIVFSSSVSINLKEGDGRGVGQDEWKGSFNLYIWERPRDYCMMVKEEKILVTFIIEQVNRRCSERNGELY